MRSIVDGEDRTARARLRDAAIRVFARDGFGATVRAVAEAAGVSPGLLIHHFGSKDNLRAECDEHVLAMVRAASRDKVAIQSGPHPFERLMARFDRIEDDGPWVVYLIRSLQSGGELARALHEHLVADTALSLRDAVEAGTVRPSVDEPMRAYYLVNQSLGSMLVDLVAHPPPDWSDAGAIVRGYLDRNAVAATEMAVHGVLATPQLLDTFLDHLKEQ